MRPILALVGYVRRMPKAGWFPWAGSAAALVVYLGVAWFLLTPNAVWSPDEGAKWFQMINLRYEAGHLAYDIAYPGRELDPTLQFALSNTPDDLFRVRDHSLYFQRLPIFPLLSRPFFQWLGAYGLYVLPAVGGALISLLALSLLEPGDRRLTMWVLIVLGSPVAIYATLFWEHTLASALALLGVWLAFQPLPEKFARPRWAWARWLGAGILFGVSISLRQELAILVLAFISAYWLLARKSLRRILLTAVVMALMVLPYPFLHQALFGGQAMPDNTTYLFYPFMYLRQAGWRIIPELLIGPSAAESINPGWLGNVWTVAALGTILVGFWPAHWRGRQSLLGLGLAIGAVAAIAFLFTPVPYRSAHGLLFTTPWAVLGLCRMREVWQRSGTHMRILVLTVGLGLLGYIVGIAGLRLSSPQGGLEWGARFALTFYPLLALIAAWDWQAKTWGIAASLIGVLVLAGIGFQVRGMGVIRHDKQINAALNQAIMATPDAYVVSDLMWLPYNTAPLTVPKAIFVATTPGRLAEWVKLAASHQAQHFSLVTLNASLITQTNALLDTLKLQAGACRPVENLLICQVQIQPN